MKLLFALSTLIAAVAAIPEIAMDSPLGQHLLAHARKLGNDNNNNKNGNNNNNAEFTETWVANYAVKFQGCHQIKQWNSAAADDADVRISTKRLVRFRLCPADSCSASKSAGCTANYGDYIIDMDIFTNAWYQARTNAIEAACESALTSCGCDQQDQNDDNTEEKCEYDCYVAAKLDNCIEYNPYTGEMISAMDLTNYMQCTQLNLNQNGNNGKRQLADNNNNNQVAYYVGPYCANQGGSIMMGMFTDDTCTTPSTDVTFDSLAGFALPYSTSSLVTEDCITCLEGANNDEDATAQANDAADADTVIEACETLYWNSGKCENTLPSGTVSTANNNGCNYMQGIRIVRQDGIIDTGSSRPSAVATAFIVIFAMAFAAMAFYVWYLRTRLGVKQNTLL